MFGLTLVLTAVSDYLFFLYGRLSQMLVLVLKITPKLRLQFMFAIILIFILRGSVNYRDNPSSRRSMYSRTVATDD